MKRRLIIVVSILLILAAAWSGAWYWLAGIADRRAQAALDEIARQGIDVECRERGIVGFPFALRIACGATVVTERASATRASLSGLTGGASIFSPMTATIAITAPAGIESPHLVSPASLTWEEAELGVGVGGGGPRGVSFDTTDFSGTFALLDLPSQTIAAAAADGSLFPSSSGGSDVAVNFTDLSIANGDTRFPPVSGTAKGEISLPPRALLSGAGTLQTPLTVRAIEVLFESGEARLGAEGDLAIDAEGVLDGSITLRVAGAEALPAFIEALPRQWQNLGNMVAGGLFALGQPATLDGDPASELTIRIDRGVTQIGPVPIELPRLRF